MGLPNNSGMKHLIYILYIYGRPPMPSCTCCCPWFCPVALKSATFFSPRHDFHVPTSLDCMIIGIRTHVAVLYPGPSHVEISCIIPLEVTWVLIQFSFQYDSSNPQEKPFHQENLDHVFFPNDSSHIVPRFLDQPAKSSFEAWASRKAERIGLQNRFQRGKLCEPKTRPTYPTFWVNQQLLLGPKFFEFLRIF